MLDSSEDFCNDPVPNTFLPGVFTCIRPSVVGLAHLHLALRLAPARLLPKPFFMCMLAAAPTRAPPRTAPPHPRPFASDPAACSQASLRKVKPHHRHRRAAVPSLAQAAPPAPGPLCAWPSPTGTDGWPCATPSRFYLYIYIHILIDIYIYVYIHYYLYLLTYVC